MGDIKIWIGLDDTCCVQCYVRTSAFVEEYLSVATFERKIAWIGDQNLSQRLEIYYKPMGGLQRQAR